MNSIDPKPYQGPDDEQGAPGLPALADLPAGFADDWEETSPFTLHPKVKELIGPGEAEELQRLLSLMEDKGWKCRQQIDDLFDDDADYSAIEGVGEVRAPLFAALMGLPYGQETDAAPSFDWWTMSTGIAVRCDGEGDWVDYGDQGEGSSIGEAHQPEIDDAKPSSRMVLPD